jgi:hypothetical protein
MHFNNLVNKNNAEYNQRQRDITKASLESNKDINNYKKDHESHVKRQDVNEDRAELAFTNST